MSFIYNENAGENILVISGENFAHIKALRIKIGDNIKFRNLRDDFLYKYRLVEFDKKSVTLELDESLLFPQKPKRDTKIIWCAVEPKTVEKTLPALNELGIKELVIVFCARSQGSFKYDLERLHRIAVSSCEQCDRSEPIKISLEKQIPDEPFYMIDFGGKPINGALPDGNYLIGPEGGFSENEKIELQKKAKNVFCFENSFVLRSETAAIAIASNLTSPDLI